MLRMGMKFLVMLREQQEQIHPFVSDDASEHMLSVGPEYRELIFQRLPAGIVTAGLARFLFTIGIDCCSREPAGDTA